MHYYASQLLIHHVTSNPIAPALIASDMLAGANLPPASSMPLGRLGWPEEVAMIAQMIVANEYMTGQTIHVNAGPYMT